MAGPKRRKIGPRAINRAVPAWVEAYVKSGIEPASGSDDEVQFCGWCFWDEPVPGLPPADSPEGAALIKQAWEVREKAARRRS